MVQNPFSRARDKAKGVWRRAYADFLMPSRLEQYRAFLQAAKQHGYEAHSMRSFWQVLQKGGPSPTVRYLLLRNDVDTDVETARAMWEIDRELRVSGSYYFRLSTAQSQLMQEMEHSGTEASYHYEELSTLAKQLVLKRAEDVRLYLEDMRALFAENLQQLRSRTGLPMITVAAHGDFANRRLGVSNSEVLADEGLRKRLCIELETYDEQLLMHVTSRHSDTLYPTFWKGEDPLRAIERGEHVVYVLFHPRHWRTHPKENLYDDVCRFVEGVRYRFGQPQITDRGKQRDENRDDHRSAPTVH